MQHALLFGPFGFPHPGAELGEFLVQDFLPVDAVGADVELEEEEVDGLLLVDEPVGCVGAEQAPEALELFTGLDAGFVGLPECIQEFIAIGAEGGIGLGLLREARLFPGEEQLGMLGRLRVGMDGQVDGSNEPLAGVSFLGPGAELAALGGESVFLGER